MHIYKTYPNLKEPIVSIYINCILRILFVNVMLYIGLSGSTRICEITLTISKEREGLSLHNKVYRD